MDWGNAIVRSKEKDTNGNITSLTMDLNLEGDFRKTKKKITWLAQPTTGHPLAQVSLVDFDYLITKKKLEETDELKDFVTPVTEFKESGYADANVLELKKGDIIQFERKGYYIYDDEKDGVHEFFKIPDGKAAGIASKASVPAVATPVAAPTPAEKKGQQANVNKGQPITSMYTIDTVYGDEAQVDVGASNMYEVESIYKS